MAAVAQGCAASVRALLEVCVQGFGVVWGKQGGRQASLPGVPILFVWYVHVGSLHHTTPHPNIHTYVSISTRARSAPTSTPSPWAAA